MVSRVFGLSGILVHQAYVQEAFYEWLLLSSVLMQVYLWQRRQINFILVRVVSRLALVGD